MIYLYFAPTFRRRRKVGAKYSVSFPLLQVKRRANHTTAYVISEYLCIIAHRCENSIMMLPPYAFPFRLGARATCLRMRDGRGAPSLRGTRVVPVIWRCVYQRTVFAPRCARSSECQQVHPPIGQLIVTEL